MQTRPTPDGGHPVVEHSNAYSTLEVDGRTTLPEVLPDSGIEVCHLEKETSLASAPGQETKSRPWLTRKKLLAALVVFLAIGAIVGGAVGGTMGKKRQNPTKNTDQSSDLSTGQSGIQGLGTLYPNTSLAATTLPNKDRRVYFQDASGHIREAQYSYSTGTWDTAIGFVVSEAAINGTSIAADSANVTTREMESYTQIGVAFALQLDSKDNPVLGVVVRGGNIMRWTNITRIRDIEVAENPYHVNCSTKTKIAVKFAQDPSRDLNSSREFMDTWINVVYQPNMVLENKMTPFLLWSDESGIVVASGGDEGGAAGVDDTLSAEPGRAFSLAPYNIGSDPYYGVLYMPGLEIEAQGNPGIKSLGITNLLNHSCVEFCDGWWENGAPNVMSLGTDMMAVQVDDKMHRVFVVNPDSTLRSYYTSPETNRFVTNDTALGGLDIRIPSAKFAVTTDRYGLEDSTDDIYLYFQLNETHLTEISYQKGYWNSTRTLIAIP